MKKILLIVFSLLLALGLSYWALVDDDQRSSYSQLGSQIAEIKNPLNQVKIKHASDFFFHQISKNHPGFHNTQIFTETNSQALVTYPDSIELFIPQNTLITLTRPVLENEQLVIELAITQGELQFSSTKNKASVRVKYQDQAFSFEAQPNTKGKVSYQNASQQATLTIFQGQLKLPTETGLSVAINQGESVRVQTNIADNIQVQSISERATWRPQLLDPPPQTYFDSPRRAFFRWSDQSTVAPDSLVELEIGYNADMIGEVQSLNVSGMNEFIIPFESLKESKVFWRLRRQMDNGDWTYSPTSDFAFSKNSSLQLLPPEKVFQERGRWKANFSFSTSSPESRFEVQAAKDSFFNNIYDQSISTTPVSVYMDESGEFFFRARQCYHASDCGPWSNIIRDTIRPPLKSPIFKIEQEQLQTNGLATLQLKWEAIEFAKDYVIQFSELQNFRQFVKMDSTHLLSYTLDHKFNRPGFVRVLARSKEGEISPANSALSYRGVADVEKFKSISILPPLLDDTQPQAFLLASWDQNEKIPAYELLYQNLSLNEKKSVQTPNIEIKIPISNREGVHQLAIKPLVNNKIYFSKTSKASQISYQPPGPLFKPNILTPKYNEVFLIPQTVQPNIRISWSNIAYAKWYVLEISKQPNFQPLYKSIKIEQAEHIMSDRLPDGKWYIRVKARNPHQTSEWSDKGEFYFGS